MTDRRQASVWLFAFGYFACYVPYSALTKWLSSSRSGTARVFSGLELLPATVLASTLAMMLSFSLLKFWGKATQHRVGRWEIPWPTRWTFLSGLATALILLTTTLAYTFEGVSIPFVMLLMRGGVLLLAPIVDAITKRRVRWFSWIALFLSASALLDAVVSRDGKGIPLLCALDISLYLAGYFVRLRLMSKLGKSDDPAVNTRYFVEEANGGNANRLGTSWLARRRCTVFSSDPASNRFLRTHASSTNRMGTSCGSLLARNGSLRRPRASRCTRELVLRSAQSRGEHSCRSARVLNPCNPDRFKRPFQVGDRGRGGSCGCNRVLVDGAEAPASSVIELHLEPEQAAFLFFPIHGAAARHELRHDLRALCKAAIRDQCWFRALHAVVRWSRTSFRHRSSAHAHRGASILPASRSAPSPSRIRR